MASSSSEEQPLFSTPPRMVPTYLNLRTPGAPTKVGCNIEDGSSDEDADVLSPLKRKTIEDAMKLAEREDRVLNEAAKKHTDALKRSQKAKKAAAEATKNVSKANMNDDQAFHEAESLFSKAHEEAVSAAQEVSATGMEMYKAQERSLDAKYSLSVLQSADREAWLMDNDGAGVNDMIKVKIMYSRFVSYRKDKNPDHILMPWNLSERQFEKFQEIYVIAKHIKPEEAKTKIKNILELSAQRLKAKGDFWFHIPKWDKKYLEYCHTLEIPLLRRGKMVYRSFLKAGTRHTASMMLWLLHHLYQNLEKDKIETERELFYRGKHIFRTLKNAATCLTEICCMLECTSASLNVLPEQNGAITGRLILRMEGGKVVDANCPEGVQLPRDLRKIKEIKVDEEVEFVLVVEKGTIYNFLRREHFHEKRKCLILTGFGMADERTRNFVRILQEQTKLPLFGMADADAWGLVIMKTFAKGSVSLIHDNFSLAAVSIHWLGISTIDIEDIERLRSKKILNRCSSLAPKERTMLKNLMLPQFMLSPLWCQRILHMLNINKKASFEDLHSFGESYAADVHVPFLIDRVMKDLGKTNGNAFGTKKLSFDEVKKGTNNFSSLIGTGSLGQLYSFILHGGEHLAVRKLKVESTEKIDKFRVQVATLSKFKHENLLDLHGFATNEDQCLLAYEFAPCGSLYDILHGRKGPYSSLQWQQRINIAIDIAKGLEYLHEKAHPPIVHGDIRPSNILLFENHKAKIAEFNIVKLSSDFYNIKATSTSSSTSQADFSLARQCTDVHEIINYWPPECRGREPTNKLSDIFSFALVLSELLTGKEFSVELPPWSKFLTKFDAREESKKLLKGYVDPKLAGGYSANELDKFAEVIIDGLHLHAICRPRISYIVEVLSHLGQ